MQRAATFIPDSGRPDPVFGPKDLGEVLSMLMLPVPAFVALCLAFLTLRTLLSGGRRGCSPAGCGRSSARC